MHLFLLIVDIHIPSIFFTLEPSIIIQFKLTFKYMSRSVTILGAGLVGALLGTILRKKGYEVNIYERRPDMRKEKIGAGKSINLAMSNRGWKAIALAGIKAEIEPIAIPMTGRFLHQKDGSSALQAYGKNGEAIYSVSRGELNKKLMTAAENNGATLHFNHKCLSVDVASNTVVLEDENGQTKTIKADLLFGADGAHSTLRNAYTLMDRVDSSRSYLECGYKELYIPPANDNGGFLIEKNALHIWPRNHFMMIALANDNGSFTCTLFLPFEGQPSFENIQTTAEIEAFFKEQFPSAVPLMPSLIEDFKQNPVASLVYTKIDRYSYKDQSCIIGDAAHAVVPFYGQGMNAGFEDVSVLAELMEQYGNDWNDILQEYNRLRVPNGHAISYLALENFIEMKEKVMDSAFLERKKIEKDLGLRFPGQFNSVYETVSFSFTPYQEAVAAIAVQDELFAKIKQDGDYFSNIEQADYVAKVATYIADYEQQLKAKIATLK